MIDGGLILTAAHVVAGSLSVSVTPSASATGEPMSAQVVALDPANDLALLSVPGLSAPGLRLGSFVAGDTGAALIFRDGKVVEQPFTITRPVIVRILDIYERDKVSREGYQLEIEIDAGDSGAVLVGADGKVGAVLYAKSRGTEDRAWGANMSAVPALIAAASAGPLPVAPVGECAR